MKTFFKIDFALQLILITAFILGLVFHENLRAIDLSLSSYAIKAYLIIQLIFIAFSEEPNPKNPRLKLLLFFSFGLLISFTSIFILGAFAFVLFSIIGLSIPILVLLNLYYTYQYLKGVKFIKLQKSFENILDSEEIFKIIT